MSDNSDLLIAGAAIIAAVSLGQTAGKGFGEAAKAAVEGVGAAVSKVQDDFTKFATGYSYSPSQSPPFWQAVAPYSSSSSGYFAYLRNNNEALEQFVKLNNLNQGVTPTNAALQLALTKDILRGF